MGYFHDPFRAGSTEAVTSSDETPVEVETSNAPKVPNGTTKEVLSWVGEDKDRAQAALDKENADEDPRKGLIKELEKLV